jgi:hypothetical protein
LFPNRNTLALRLCKDAPRDYPPGADAIWPFPLSPRNVGHLLHERGFEIRHENLRYWWSRVAEMRASRQWQRQRDEIYVQISGVKHYLWQGRRAGSRGAAKHYSQNA